MAKPKWITIGTAEGSMNGSSEITAAAYTGRVDREGTITGTTAGGATDTTAVTQVGAAEVITIETKTYSANKVGQTINIQGKSNSANLSIVAGDSVIPGLIYKLAVAGVTDESWDGSEDTTVDGDPGASAIYDFTLTVTVPENKSESALVAKFAVKNANADVTSGEITINQAAGVKNYAVPTISAFAYPEGNIPASGGSKTPTLSYSQTWGWNESNTNGGTISGTLAAPASGTTFAFSGAVVNATTGVVTAASKGTTVSDVTEVDAVTVTVTLNGKTSASSASVSVKQAANSATYGEVTIGQATPVSLAAPGETYQIVPAMKQTVTYTSGATRTEATPADNKVQLSANYTVKTAKEGFSFEANTGKVTVSPNPTSVPREGFVVTILAEGEGGKTATKDITFNQQGSSSTLDISPDTMSFIAAGETKTLTITSNDSWTLS